MDSAIRRLNNRGMIQELIIFVITLTKYWCVETFSETVAKRGDY